MTGSDTGRPRGTALRTATQSRDFDIQGVTLDALDRSALAFIVLDEFDKVSFVSRAAEHLWGCSGDALLGRDVGQALSPELGMSGGGGRFASGTPLPGLGQEVVIERPDGLRLDAVYTRSVLDIGGRRWYLVVVQTNDAASANARDTREHQLLMAMSRANRPVLVLDARRRVVHVNRAFTEVFGYAAREMIGRDPAEMLPSPGVPADDLARHRALRWGQSCSQAVMRLRGKTGREFWFRIHSTPLEMQDEVFQGYSVDVLEDITEDRLIREMERDVLQALASSTSFEDLGSYICRRIESIAPGVLVSVCGISDHRIRPWAAPGFPAEYGEFFRDMEIGEGVASCGTAAYRGEPVMVRDIATNPLWRHYRHVMLPHGFRACWTYPVKRRDGSVAATFAFYFKQGGEPEERLELIAEAGVHLCVLAIEREENARALARLARFDTLTGLPNRSSMLQHLGELLAAPGERGISVLALNIDRFRYVNDALGHAAGDQVLARVANRLRACLGPEAFLARMQGDQFAIVARCSEATAGGLAGQLQESVDRPLEIGEHQLSLSASIGISHYPGDGHDRDTLLASAEATMMAVSKGGGANFALCGVDANPVEKERLLLGMALKQAIASGRLMLYYQPQIRTDSGRLHGLEALARWHDDDFGHVQPDRFIALAEEIGQIEPLSRWVLREACRQLACWRAEGLPVPVVAVNLSPANLQRLDLPGYVAGLLHEFSLLGDSLTIELTESSMVALTPQMREVVGAIRALGVGLAVDDFGTGYSSLSHLVELPVTEVKIDRSFICKALEQDRLRALVSAVIYLGGSLGLTVVAEGVETAEQRALLSEYRCPVLQGYLFSHPLSPQDAAKWLSGALPAETR